MKISWIKLDKDKKSFGLFESLGFNVLKIEDETKIDDKIDELIDKKYNTIIVTNDIAGLSNKINKEYIKNKNIKIIIDKNRDDFGGYIE